MTEEQLKVTLVQTPLLWEDKAGNIEMFTNHLSEINETDLIILPEMFSTGFSMNAKNMAESKDGKSVEWMKKMSRLKNAAISGSLIIYEDGNYYNRLFFITPEGKVSSYNKKHLFSLAKEEETYSPGREKLIVEYKGWKICPLVCYDLRFPVWSRNVEDYDLLIYVANWPEKRSDAWKTLLKARAIENQCFVAGVNRVGEDKTGLNYSGDSVLIDALGEKISDIPKSTLVIKTFEINKKELNQIRSKFQFLNDRDQFSID